jgi:hypothetical protein
MSHQPFHTAHYKKREMAVHAFLIWRAGAANSWDVSAQDIANETGLHVNTVRRICKAKGWSSRLRTEYLGHVDRYPVDVAMQFGEKYA